jgi:ParB/RepB/Spo0J family partition protein
MADSGFKTDADTTPQTDPQTGTAANQPRDLELAAEIAAHHERGLDLDHLTLAHALERRSDSVKRSLARLAEAGWLTDGAPAPGLAPALDASPAGRALLEAARARLSGAAQPSAGASNPQALTAGPPDETAPIRLIPVARLHHSDLNPRKVRAPSDIEDLALSLLDSGQLQNMVGRPHPDRPGEFEIAAGGTRLEAGRLLLARGQASDLFDPARGMHVLVREMTDTQMVLHGIAENAQRTDVHPLDEGQALLALMERQTQAARASGLEGGAAEREAGKLTGELATALKRARNWVQERIRFARNLSPEVQTEWRAGTLTQRQVRAFAARPAFALQDEVLADMIEEGPEYFDAEDIACRLDQAAFPADAALFDRDAYDGVRWTSGAASNGAVPEPEYFGDVDQAKRLQIAALQARCAEELKSGRPVALVVEGWCGADTLEARGLSGIFRDEAHADGTPAGLILVMSGQGIFNREQFVHVIAGRTGAPGSTDPASAHEGLPPPALRAGADASASPSHGAGGGEPSPLPQQVTAEGQPWQRRHWVAAKEAKTAALQARLAEGDRRKDDIARALVIIASCGHAMAEDRDTVRLQPIPRNGEDREFGEGGQLAGALADFGPVAGITLTPVKSGPARIAITDAAAALAGLAGHVQLNRLFCAAIADRIGTWCGYQAGPGDTGMVIALAGLLNLPHAAAHQPPDAAWFGLLTRGQRAAAARDMGVSDPAAIESPASLADAAAERQWSPPDWAYATPQTIYADVTAMLAGARAGGESGAPGAPQTSTAQAKGKTVTAPEPPADTPCYPVTLGGFDARPLPPVAEPNAHGVWMPQEICRLFEAKLERVDIYLARTAQDRWSWSLSIDLLDGGRTGPIRTRDLESVSAPSRSEAIRTAALHAITELMQRAASGGRGRSTARAIAQQQNGEAFALFKELDE